MDHDAAFDDEYTAGYGDRAPAAAPQAADRSEAHSDASAGDIVAIASDLVETQLRARPIPTLLAALAAGWLVGRILR